MLVGKLSLFYASENLPTLWFVLGPDTDLYIHVCLIKIAPRKVKSRTQDKKQNAQTFNKSDAQWIFRCNKIMVAL